MTTAPASVHQIGIEAGRTGWRRRSPAGSMARGRVFRAVLLVISLGLGSLALLWGMMPHLFEDSGERVWNPPKSTLGAPRPNEAMAWRPVAIGGGGFITGLSADDAGKTWVARTDVYGAYRWDAAADRWVQLVSARSMPQENVVQAGAAAGVYEIVVAPGDPNRLYMAFMNGVFRSDDGGGHWRRVLGGPGKDEAFALDANSEFRLYGAFMAVSPENPDVVAFGSPDRGLWRSGDGGGHWERVAAVPPARDMRPGKPGVQAPGILVWFRKDGGTTRLWAASAGNGVYAGNADGGGMASVGGPRFVRRGAFAADGSFYAADGEEKRVMRLSGGRWEELTARIADGRVFAAVAVDPAHGTVMVGDQGGRLWCSVDGATWNMASRSAKVGDRDPPWLAIADHAYFATGQIMFDPNRSGRLWTAAGTGVFTAQPASACAPVVWESRTRGIEELVTNDAVSAPGFPPVFAAWDFGIHVKPDLDAFSTGFGPRQRMLIAAQQVDWTPARPGFLVTNASDTRMGCCSEDGQSVLAGYSEDGGRTWTRFASLPTPPGTDPADPWRMSFGTIAVSSDDPDNIVWEPAFNRSPFYTLDRGRTWSRVVLPGEMLPHTGSFKDYWPQRKTLAADRAAPGTFYLLHSGDGDNISLAGVWVTRDKGQRWSRVFAGQVVPDSSRAAKLRAVPGKAGWLFLTNGQPKSRDSRLRRSVDGGKTWTVLEDVDGVDDVAFGKAPRGSDMPTIFVSGRVGGRFGIWRSVDNARTWQRLTGFPLDRLDQVTVIEGDKNVFGRVYVGFTGSGWIYGEPAPCRPGTISAAGEEECSAVEQAR
ncbi:sialidase family protein [Novosphingobium sp. LASN5T]|uniref:WD40/YVTN/BNR-like repeat-containing protein n=1 Tax=Novosphingobium sp. LASN5T TaxID=2491021 RepID=UPI001CC1DDFF|nr:sialidase family protein [Novosphingobium sp. LASN5T]